MYFMKCKNFGCIVIVVQFLCKFLYPLNSILLKFKRIFVLIFYLKKEKKRKKKKNYRFPFLFNCK